MARKNRRKKKHLKSPIHARLQAEQDAIYKRFEEKRRANKLAQKQSHIELDADDNETRVRHDGREGKIIRPTSDDGLCHSTVEARPHHLHPSILFNGLSAGSDNRYSLPDRDNHHDRYGLKRSGAYSNAKRHRSSWDEIAAKSGPVFSITVGPDGEEVKTPIKVGSIRKKKFGQVKSAVAKHTNQELAKLRSLNYADYLMTDHWQKIRKSKLKSVGFQCEKCKSSTKLFEVHHIHYSSRGHERLIDLKVLCSECHDWFHRTHHIHRR